VIEQDIDDLIAELAQPEPEPPADRIPTHDRFGCYDNLPPVPGHGTGPWPRVSDMDFFSDDKYLIQWQQRQVVRALELNQRELTAESTDEDLFKPMRGSRFDAATSYGKKKINGIVDRCHELIGSHKGSELGTKFHEFAELLDGGADPKAFDLTPDLLKMLKAYWKIRKYFDIQPVPGYLERTVFIPELGACGTFDHLDTDGDSDLPVVGDTKTQSTMHFSNIAIPQQLGSYAHASLVLDRPTWTWQPMPEVNQELAVVLWCPADEPGRASVQDIDIVKGWHYALAAREVREDWRTDTSTIRQRATR
jgi:hypothetical protein